MVSPWGACCQEGCLIEVQVTDYHIIWNLEGKPLMSRPDKQKWASSARAAPSKKERTRDALISTSIRLIAKKGIEATSVLDITEALGISNGTFYYYFPNKERLLEEVGHAIVARLVDRIESVDQPDPAVRVARGPLIILQYVDRHPEQRAIILRVVDDPEGVHANLHDRLLEDLADGKRIGRFPIEDIDVAVRFCRALVGSAIRLKHEGRGSEQLGAMTAIRTLSMLGVSAWEAATLVEREQAGIGDG